MQRLRLRVSKEGVGGRFSSMGSGGEEREGKGRKGESERGSTRGRDWESERGKERGLACRVIVSGTFANATICYRFRFSNLLDRSHFHRRVGSHSSKTMFVLSVLFSKSYCSAPSSFSLSFYRRTIVIHKGTDDLGKGGHPDSLKTGNA